MKVLYLDLSMGAAGDMLMGALASLLSDEELSCFVDEINAVGIPNVSVEIVNDKKCEVDGKHVNVTINGQKEESVDVHEHDKSDEHEHEHKHEHTHHHTSMAEIAAIIDSLKVSNSVRREVKNVYKRIAKAESRAHGTEVSEVHFHEVGMMDALADITGCAMLFEKLDVDEIVASPINTGYGNVKCAHGILPVPAPATALLLEGIPCYSGNIEGELCTPTGAALIGNYVNDFCGMPFMKIENIGYGTGTKDFETANVIRVFIGEPGSLENDDFEEHTKKVEQTAKAFESSRSEDTIIEMNCNIDDMTAEEIAYATKLIMSNGAKDVYTIPVTMKKGRPGIILGVLCKPEDRERLAELIFKNTTTIGIRYTEKKRMVMDRNEKELTTDYGDVRVKIAEGYGVIRCKAEYEDLRRIADEKNISIAEVKDSIARLW